VARGLGRPVVLTKLRPDYSADVHKLVEEADKAHGGLIYICNPNNPTSAITTRKDLEWLVANLPANTILLVDEAYIHFGESPDLVSALPYVRQAKDLVVTRTFSKIYGMAGLRVGFAAAKPDLIQRMTPLRMGVVSIVSAQAVVAALADRENILRERRASLVKTRRELCDWLRERKLSFIEPHANFIMIDVGRNAREFINAMPRLGVAPGRPSRRSTTCCARPSARTPRWPNSATCSGKSTRADRASTRPRLYPAGPGPPAARPMRADKSHRVRGPRRGCLRCRSTDARKPRRPCDTTAASPAGCPRPWPPDTELRLRPEE